MPTLEVCRQMLLVAENQEQLMAEVQCTSQQHARAVVVVMISTAIRCLSGCLGSVSTVAFEGLQFEAPEHACAGRARGEISGGWQLASCTALALDNQCSGRYQQPP